MSQNDMSIANAAGSVVRADINSALQALASSSAGSSAPSTTYGNQFWFDTANDILKHRDEANTTWVNVASLSGSTWIPYRSGTLQGPMSTLDDTAIARDLVMSGKRIKLASATIASATTVDLSTAAGNCVTISGGTTITGFGTTQSGEIYFLTFSGTPQVTHNATSLIMPGGASRTMAAGDSLIAKSEGSGNFRVLAIFKADGSAIVGATAVATQADQETATSTTAYVTPGRQHYHPSAAKAWAKWSMSAVLQKSYNVTSITDNGTGDWTVNFTTAFSTADYVAVAQVQTSSGRYATVNVMNTTDCEVECKDNSSAHTETSVTSAMLACFGDQ
jgi:hypothetical protein